MLTTEQEARTKWCPHARVNTLVQDMDHASTAVGGAACNRSSETTMTDKPLCIASGCMAWRWSDKTVERRAEKVGVEPPSGEGWRMEGSKRARRFGATTVRLQDWIREKPNPRGYCGAFGKPEGA